MQRYYVEFKETVLHSAIILADDKQSAIDIATEQFREGDEPFWEHSDGSEIQCCYLEIDKGYAFPVFNAEGYQGKDYSQTETNNE